LKKDNEGIIVKFSYNPDYITRIKILEGYKWNPEEKYWSIPYSQLEKFLSTFDGEKVKTDTSV